MMKLLIEKTIKSVGIAAGGGALTLGAGTVNVVNVDFVTTVAVAIFSVAFNFVYTYIKLKVAATL